jgi:hypothetical protein
MKLTSRSTPRKARKTVGVGAVVLALTAALLGVPAPASADPNPTIPTLINQQRAQANPRCKPLNSSPQLQAAADRHAKDLATNGWRTDHNDSDGTTAPISVGVAKAGSIARPPGSPGKSFRRAWRVSRVQVVVAENQVVLVVAALEYR